MLFTANILLLLTIAETLIVMQCHASCAEIQGPCSNTDEGPHCVEKFPICKSRVNGDSSVDYFCCETWDDIMYTWNPDG